MDILNNILEQDKKLLNKSGLFFKEEKLSHAYIFQGEKEEILRVFEAFARRIFHSFDGVALDDGNISKVPDLLMESSDRPSIDRIREINSLIYRRPLRAKHKIIFLENADKMLQAAQNAMLKSLEEPPEHIIWVLASKNRARLLSTIRSRCILIRINIGEKDEESIALSDEDGESTFLLDCINGKGYESFMSTEILDSKSKDFFLILENWTDILNKALDYKLLNKEERSYSKRTAIIKEVASILSPEKISEKIIMVEETRQGLEKNWNQLLALENLCLKLGD